MEEVQEHGCSSAETTQEADALTPRAQLLQVTPELLPNAWPHARELLENSPEIWEHYYSLEDLYDNILEQRLQLWLVNNTEGFFLAVITGLETFPQQNVCNVYCIAGTRMGEVLWMLELIEQWAQELGASRMHIWGREGFERKLRSLGYRKQLTQLYKEIGGRRLN